MTPPKAISRRSSSSHFQLQFPPLGARGQTHLIIFRFPLRERARYFEREYRVAQINRSGATSPARRFHPGIGRSALHRSLNPWVAAGPARPASPLDRSPMSPFSHQPLAALALWAVGLPSLAQSPAIDRLSGARPRDCSPALRTRPQCLAATSTTMFCKSINAACIRIPSQSYKGCAVLPLNADTRAS